MRMDGKDTDLDWITVYCCTLVAAILQVDEERRLFFQSPAALKPLKQLVLYLARFTKSMTHGPILTVDND